MPLYLVRHAPVTLKGTCYGQIDVPTAIPAEAAINTVHTHLQLEPPPTVVWSSPLQRCRDLAHAYTDTVRFDRRLMEASFGLWEGMTWDEIHSQHPLEMARWGENWLNVPPPEGESASMVQTRFETFVDVLEPGIHLAFSHAGIIRAARVLLGGWTWSQAMDVPVVYLGLERFKIPSDP